MSDCLHYTCQVTWQYVLNSSLEGGDASNQASVPRVVPTVFWFGMSAFLLVASVIYFHAGFLQLACIIPSHSWAVKTLAHHKNKHILELYFLELWVYQPKAKSRA